MSREFEGPGKEPSIYDILPGLKEFGLNGKYLLVVNVAMQVALNAAFAGEEVDHSMLKQTPESQGVGLLQISKLSELLEGEFVKRNGELEITIKLKGHPYRSVVVTIDESSGEVRVTYNLNEGSQA